MGVIMWLLAPPPYANFMQYESMRKCWKICELHADQKVTYQGQIQEFKKKEGGGGGGGGQLHGGPNH